MFEQGSSFQSNAMTGSPSIPVGNYCPTSSSLIYDAFPGNSGLNTNNTISGYLQSGNSTALTSLSGLFAPVSSLKRHCLVFSDWSVEEQFQLENGIENIHDELKLMKYVKIAATLPNKTVRDVALRCRWMTRKRRRQEEYIAAKMASDRKNMPLQDNMVDSSSRLNILSDVPQPNAVPAPFMIDPCHNPLIPCEGLSPMSMNLMQQNAETFNQISYNMSAGETQLQDNIGLFSQARSNIGFVMNNMSEMPGVMSQMPPLPISIDEDLATTILNNDASQEVPYNVPSSTHPETRS